MATQLFKDGQSVWVEANRVQHHIQLGWSPDDPHRPVVHPKTILPAGMGLEKMTPQEQRATILGKMGIENISHLNPAGQPARPEPIKQIAPEAPKSRRGRPRKSA